MAMKKFYKEQSRFNWYIDGEVTNYHLKLGAILRIADATEIMAKNYVQMQNDLNWYKKKYEEKEFDIISLKNRISALRGVITKLKAKK